MDIPLGSSLLCRCRQILCSSPRVPIEISRKVAKVRILASGMMRSWKWQDEQEIPFPQEPSKAIRQNSGWRNFEDINHDA
jgi:hypothetical protein